MKNIWLIALISIALTTASCSKDDDKETAIYTVTFETDGGTPTPTTQRVEAGNLATAPTSNPTKANYVFVFWHLSGYTTVYNFQSPINSNLTLHARWQAEATVEYWQVTWDLNGGVWSTGDNHATQVVKTGTLAEPVAPVKTGSTFDGWYKEAVLTNKVSFPFDVSALTSHFTLYAKWTVTEENGSFTSIAALSAWLKNQPENTAETAYEVRLQNINLDSNNNWGDLGVAIGGANKTKYIELDLSGCTGTTIPDGSRSGNTTYGAFVNCDNLIAITLPPGLTSIGKYAFYNCDGFTTLNFPEGLKTIGDWAFCSCSKKLASVNLPKGLQSIGESAFRECLALTSVSMHDGVESIGPLAFYGDAELETITLSKGLKTIDTETFAYCSKGLKSITIPEGVVLIKTRAFHHCEVLTEVIMQSATPPNLIVSAFQYTSALTIKVPAGSVDTYKAANGWKDYANKIVANTN